MESLKDVIVALRREIEEALKAGQPLPEGARLQAERVVATIHFGVDSASGPASFVLRTENRAADHPHSVTIEFKLLSASQSLDERAPNATTIVSHESRIQLDEAAAEEITRQLVHLFGAPGFDSAARATVFREALENLSEADARTFVQLLRGISTNGHNDAAKRALSLVRRVCQSGPGGFEKGKALLSTLFQKFSVQTVVDHVRRVWKTQEEWIR